jgi:hypothetical protein
MTLHFEGPGKYYKMKVFVRLMAVFGYAATRSSRVIFRAAQDTGRAVDVSRTSHPERSSVDRTPAVRALMDAAGLDAGFTEAAADL